MSNGEQSYITPCELREAFEALEQVYRMFEDIISGSVCGGLNCDERIPVPEPVRDTLVASLGGTGNGFCQGKNCMIAPQDWSKIADFVAGNAPNLAAAVQAVAGHLADKDVGKINYMTSAVPGWRSRFIKGE